MKFIRGNEYCRRSGTDQLRRRSIDVLTAIEDDSGKLLDDELLERVRSLERVLFTQDIRFKAMDEEWQRKGKRLQN